MKAFLLMAALAAVSVPASANMPAELASDPLMTQILAKHLKLENGGIKSFVAVKGTGGIELLQPAAAAPSGLTDEAAALAGLRVEEGLAEKPAKKKAKKPARRADDQLAAIDAQGAKATWDKTRK